MRASTPLLASVMIGILPACSAPTPAGESSDRAALEAELELAILSSSGQGDGTPAVISDLEIRGPTDEVGPAASRPAPRPSADVIEEPRAALVTMSQPVGVSAPELPSGEMIRPVVVSGGAAEREPSVGAVRPRSGRGVIIRGVVGRGDPCVIHRPGGARDGLGGIGILINDPTPRDIGSVAGRGAGRGAPGGIPGGGGMFIGGIR